MKKKGFTLLEMVLVLLIITAIILIAGRYFQQASEASKVTEATTKIKRIIEASYEWEKVEHTFNNLDITDLTNTNLLSANDIEGPWSGTFLLAGEARNGVFIKINITIPNVPKTACFALKDSLERQNIDTANFSCTSTRDQKAAYPKE